MSLQTWQETLVSQQIDGPTLTAAAAASCLAPAARITLPNNFFSIGKMLKVTAAGRISTVVTTPGTARFDVRLGGTVVFDSNAMSLNTVAKTNVGWLLELLLTCRSIGNGSLATIIGQGTWTSEAVIGSPLPTVGGSGSFMLPFNAAPAVGAGFDSTSALSVDLFFTQTVATGSLTTHQLKIESLN
jgi:hypothetical protein